MGYISFLEGNVKAKENLLPTECLCCIPTYLRMLPSRCYKFKSHSRIAQHKKQNKHVQKLLLKSQQFIPSCPIISFCPHQHKKQPCQLRQLVTWIDSVTNEQAAPLSLFGHLVGPNVWSPTRSMKKGPPWLFVGCFLGVYSYSLL